jgi:hypothetical protein
MRKLVRVQSGQAILTPEQIDAIVELAQRPLEVEDRSDDKAS